MHRWTLLCVLVAPLAAQTDRATLTGTITDHSGGVVPGATVSIRAVATRAEHTMTTNAAGAYTLDFLPIGEYTGTISAKGFETLTIAPFVLEVGQTRILNETMSIGAVQSEVTVQASAGGIDQSSAEIGGLIQRGQVQDIPLNGRNWASLMSLSPGAIDSSNGVESGVRFAGL